MPQVNRCRLPNLRLLPALLLFLILPLLPISAFAQGSIFGTVTNFDASTPANGDITFFGFLDDTDEELRIETSTGAGYDAGNWYDDFQNYLTEAPGNPYDYYFFNPVNGEGAHLGKLIPNNSFQQENIILAAVSVPSKPTGLRASVLSANSIMIEWNYDPGLTWHVYRRDAASNGSFFRIDDPAGSLANPGTADSFYVDDAADSALTYEYLLIAEDGSGNYSQHSDPVQPAAAGCCVGIRGNVDGDPLDDMNISDLTYLVGFVFQGGAAPACEEEADVEGSGGISVSDITYLVSALFQGGPDPVSCPNR